MVYTPAYTQGIYDAAKAPGPHSLPHPNAPQSHTQPLLVPGICHPAHRLLPPHCCPPALGSPPAPQATTEQAAPGAGRAGECPASWFQMEPRPCLQSHVCKAGAGWGGLKGDRRGEKEAGGSRRHREAGPGEGGQGTGDKDGCWTTTATTMGKSRNRDPGSGERKRRGERSTKDETAAESTDEKRPKEEEDWGQGAGRVRTRVCTPTRKPSGASSASLSLGGVYQARDRKGGEEDLSRGRWTSWAWS